jgi:hypothetical protein
MRKEATDQQETIDAIANLATATTTAEDRRAVANLTGTNTTLTKELATSNGKLITALTLVTTLTKQLADLGAGKSAYTIAGPAATVATTPVGIVPPQQEGIKRVPKMATR